MDWHVFEKSTVADIATRDAALGLTQSRPSHGFDCLQTPWFQDRHHQAWRQNSRRLPVAPQLIE